MPARAPDFESSASAIPPLRRLKCRKTRLLYSLPTVFQIAAGIKCRQSQAAAVAGKNTLFRFVKCLPIAHFWGLWRWRLAILGGAVSLTGWSGGGTWPTYKVVARARKGFWAGWGEPPLLSALPLRSSPLLSALLPSLSPVALRSSPLSSVLLRCPPLSQLKERQCRSYAGIEGVDMAGLGDGQDMLGVHLDELSDAGVFAADRSEERRVGKECRSRWSPYH